MLWRTLLLLRHLRRHAHALLLRRPWQASELCILLLLLHLHLSLHLHLLLLHLHLLLLRRHHLVLVLLPGGLLLQLLLGAGGHAHLHTGLRSRARRWWAHLAVKPLLGPAPALLRLLLRRWRRGPRSEALRDGRPPAREGCAPHGLGRKPHLRPLLLRLQWLLLLLLRVPRPRGPLHA